MSESAATAANSYRRAASKAKRERFEDALAFQIRTHRLPEPMRQHRFAQEIGRQWRFDFAFMDLRLAVEVEGIVATRAMVAKGRGEAGLRTTIVLTGGHATPEGFKEDIEKYNAATLLGWRLLRFHQQQIATGQAIDMIERTLHAFGWKRGALAGTVTP